MAYLEHYRDQKLADLPDEDLRGLDRILDSHAQLWGRHAFSEVALQGMTRGVSGLLVGRQMQRNQLRHQSERSEAALGNRVVEIKEPIEGES